MANRLKRKTGHKRRQLGRAIHVLALLGSNDNNQCGLRRYFPEKRSRGDLDHNYDVFFLHCFCLQHQQHLGDNQGCRREKSQISVSNLW